MRILNKHFLNGFYFIVDPVGNFLEAIRVHPDAVTIAGLIFSFISGILFWKGYFVLAGILLIISGVCDVLDGRLARNTSRISSFGALFDSTVDRYSEVAIFMGIAAFFNTLYAYMLIILAIAGSLLTSYVRARGEGLGIECKIGLMQRPERITFLATAAVLGGIFDRIFGTNYLLMKISMLAIALFANITVLQRVLHVRRMLKSK